MNHVEYANQSNLVYSSQAKILLEQLKDDFNMEAFEKWVSAQLNVGGAHIIEFLQIQDHFIRTEKKKEETIEAMRTVEVVVEDKKEEVVAVEESIEPETPTI